MVAAKTRLASRIRPLLLCVLSALALAAAFPRLDAGALAWVALVPLLFAIEGRGIRQVFWYAWLQGLLFFLCSLYGMGVALYSVAGAPWWLAWGPVLLLAAVEALYGAGALAGAAFINRALGLSWPLTLPITWTGLEWLRSFFPIGCPWNLLGYAAYRDPHLVQLASLTGVYGLSALIVFANAVIFTVLTPALHSRHWPMARRTAPRLGVLLGVLAAVLIYGQARLGYLRHLPAAGRLKLAMVQGNIPQRIKWDRALRQRNFQVYLDLSRKAAAARPDLIAWPESAGAFYLQPDGDYPLALWGDLWYRKQLLDLARSLHTPILLTAPALAFDRERAENFSRADLVSTQGQVVAHYDKLILVPFGEYVPGRWLLGRFVHKVVAGVDDYVPGKRQTLFQLDGAKFAVLICYESIFPELARRAVASGADLLINLSNEAWYDNSSTSYQLLAMASLRAVETGAPVVRVANTGISAIIEPDGTIDARTRLDQRIVESQTVAWSGHKTPYDAIGDLFARLCAALTATALAAAVTLRRAS